MSADILAKIAGKEVQDFIFASDGKDETSLLLKHKELAGIPFTFIAQQLTGRRKAKEKLPTLFKTRSIVYPPSLNIEQSSSEATAIYKNTLIKSAIDKRGSIADLTSGFGIDSLFFSKLFSSAYCVEPNVELLEIAKHNHRILKASNVQYYHEKAEVFLDSTDLKFDLVYVDPSRRDDRNRKMVQIADMQPNVSALQSLIFKHTNFILIKASPLLDIKQGLSEIKNVNKVYVVSVANECKELLFLVNKNFDQEPIIETVNLNSEGNVVQNFSFFFSEEREAEAILSDPLVYLYEPNSSILKSGAFKLVAMRHKVLKLSIHTHFYTSNELLIDFPGRVFKIERIDPDSNDIKRLLPERKANVITRNYPLAPEELKKKLKLKDGGEKFVIGFSDQKKKTIVLASRIK